MQAYRPDLEKELEKVSDDNLLKNGYVARRPNSIRRPSFEAGSADEISIHDIEVSDDCSKDELMSASDLKRISKQYAESSIPYINNNTNKIMKNASSWTVDMFELANASHCNPLQCVSYTVFVEKATVLDVLKIEVGNLMTSMKDLRLRISPNRTIILTRCRCIIWDILYFKCLEYGKSFTPLEKCSLFFSAAVHDVGHLGVSNNFLVRSKSDRAITYNDTSVLEHMHLSLAFSIGQKLGFFEVFPSCVYTEFRKHVIDMVLATDLGQHMAFVAQLKAFKANEKNKLHEEKENIHENNNKASDVVQFKGFRCPSKGIIRRIFLAR